MFVPVTLLRSIGVPHICALAGAAAKLEKIPAANNCATASGNAFAFADMSNLPSSCGCRLSAVPRRVSVEMRLRFEILCLGRNCDLVERAPHAIVCRGVG